MTHPPKNKLLDLINNGHTRTEISTLATLLSGNEIALLEVLLYMHDQGLIKKDDLAARLRTGADHIERTFSEQGQDGRAMAFPSRRLAAGLAAAIRMDDKDDPA
ncbi:hypothetical protein [Achromobacter sp.]|uniref:hypothetical protein n=1 Tax=Achromobacter sp. TaxID=134375 RepID=UPI000EBAF0C2|nr:hypothetical protein [Achromobacter sp.]HCW18800.1 hypothetical protein [Achromobacter sp.]